MMPPAECVCVLLNEGSVGYEQQQSFYSLSPENKWPKSENLTLQIYHTPKSYPLGLLFLCC